MPLTFYGFLFLVGSSVGFLSGLLGIGGGIILFPILFYIPQILGFESIAVKSITGLTMTQGFFASLSAMLFYRKHHLVNKSLVLTLGLSLFLSSLIGSLSSKAVPDEPLLLVFGILALSASVMMFLPHSYSRDALTEDTVTFNRNLAVMIGIVLGFFLGLVGQGGAFILIPILLYILKIPLRVALGSMLAIGLFSSTAGLAGKIATGQVPFLMAGALIIGAVPSAQLGSFISKKTATPHLRWILALVIAAAAIRIWIDIF